MKLQQACCRILDQVSDAIRQLQPADFARPSAPLSGATIGQHLRHTLEFFLCLEKGVTSGLVNYDDREHNEFIETDKVLALMVLEQAKTFVSNRTVNFALRLEVGYDKDSDSTQTVESNYFRELAYNIEHAVHHMALMKVGFRDVAPYVQLPPDFGVAASTIRHRNSVLTER